MPFRGRFYIFLHHLGVEFDARDYAIQGPVLMCSDKHGYHFSL